MALDLSNDFIKPMGDMIATRFNPYIKYFDLGKNFKNDPAFQGRMKIKYLCPNKRCQNKWSTTWGTVFIYYNLDQDQRELHYLSEVYL